MQSAVEAMRLDALGCLSKPLNPVELPLVVARARRARHTTRLEEHERQASGVRDFFFGEALAGLREQRDRILAANARVKVTPPPVLIEGDDRIVISGESGTVVYADDPTAFALVDLGTLDWLEGRPPQPTSWSWWATPARSPSFSITSRA